MAIDFSPERWARVRETYRQWWAGELERPLIARTLTGRDPGRPQPAAPVLTQATCADFSISAEEIVDRLDYELSCREFLGDAFPYVGMDVFGPGVAAAFMGAELDNSSGRVWFHPPADLPIEEIHFTYDPENRWLRRIKDICAAAMERWQGQVLVSMTDLGGSLDILSTFRPGEKLLLDLYDAPEEVQRLNWEGHTLWHSYFDDINAVLQPVNPGYSAWCSIYSDAPYFIFQCDFSYMIGPEMFDAFAAPEIEASARRIARSFYHLDGRGQLPHLDTILAMEAVDGVQWVPGDGTPGCAHWPEVYDRIFAAGKKTQLWGGYEEIYGLLQRTGVGPGVHYRTYDPHTLADRDTVIGWMKKFGVEP